MKRIFMIIIIATLVITGCTSTTEEIPEDKYMVDGNWALDDLYRFAVELDDYTGDVFEAGIYNFKSSSNNGVSRVFDIYKSKALEDKLPLENELLCSVAGITHKECDAELNVGDYIYVKPIKMEVETNNGYLVFSKR